MRKLTITIFTLLFCTLLSTAGAAQNSFVKIVLYDEDIFYSLINKSPAVTAINSSLDAEFASETGKLTKRRTDYKKRERAFDEKISEISNSGRTFTASEGKKFEEEVMRQYNKFYEEDQLIKAEEKKLIERRNARFNELIAPVHKTISDFTAELVKQYQIKLFDEDSGEILLHSKALDFTEPLFEAYKVFAATRRLPENLKFPPVKAALVSSSIINIEDEDEYDETMEKLSGFAESSDYNLVLQYKEKIPDGFSADMDITNKFTAGLKAEEDYRRGVIALNMGAHSLAIEAFSKAIQIDPNNAGAFAQRGRAYGAQKNYDFAVADLTKAISMNSGSMNMEYVYYTRGLVYYEHGKYDLAVKDHNKSIELESDNPDAFEGRAMAYARLKQYETALKDFSEAIRLKNKNSSAYHYRGHTYQNMKNYDSAISDFTKAMEFTTNSSHLYYDRAYTHSLMENYDLAISDLNQAIQTNPDFTNALLLRSQILCSKGNKKQAAADEEKVISLGKTVEKRCM